MIVEQVALIDQVGEQLGWAVISFTDDQPDIVRCGERHFIKTGKNKYREATMSAAHFVPRPPVPELYHHTV
jgi:hypothetical protein